MTNELHEKALQLLGENAESIQHGDLYSVYRAALDVFEPRLVPHITHIFLTSDIDPLEYLTEIPSNYARGLSETIGTELAIPSNITTIGTNAFQSCMNLQKITIANSVRNIYADAFLGCKRLKIINLPNTCKFIPAECFRMCISLQSIKIPEGVEQLLEAAFYSCKSLEEVYLPKTIKLVSEKVFTNCESLRDVYYNGTIEEWKSVSKRGNSFAVNRIICTDGNTKVW